MSTLNYYKFQQFHVLCTSCGGNTTREHARRYTGLCKQCADAHVERSEKPLESTTSESPSREERILAHGYLAYALEEGHYDEGNE